MLCFPFERGIKILNKERESAFLAKSFGEFKKEQEIDERLAGLPKIKQPKCYYNQFHCYYNQLHLHYC